MVEPYAFKTQKDMEVGLETVLTNMPENESSCKMA